MVVHAHRESPGVGVHRWVYGQGPHPDHGFGASAAPGDLTEADHRRNNEGFLGMIDPATGYFAEQ
jgi:hypothetical protein